MEKQHVTGKIDELKGKVKEGVGRATNNPNLEDEGAVDETKGKLKQAYADVKGAIKHSDREAGSDVNNK